MENRAKNKSSAIHLIDEEADTLTELAISATERLPQVSELLLLEIGRAVIHRRDEIADDIVTMYATIEFADGENGARRSVQLVYPKDADISSGRISIMTPVGAGLIGLRAGQSILWPDRQGHERHLKVEKVTQQTHLV